MTTKNQCVYVVDDDPVVLFILSRALRATGYRVNAFEEPAQLISLISPTTRGCIVLDLCMPTLPGLDVQQALIERGASIPLIFISERADVSAVATAMKRGAVDFLAKPIDPVELCAAVERALRKDAAIGAELLARTQARARWAKLSPREREVCRLFAEGLADKQIAAELGTAQVTVQAQRSHALQKLRLQTCIEVSRLLAQMGKQSGSDHKAA